MNRSRYAVLYANPLRPDEPIVSVIRDESDAINAVIGSRSDNKTWLGPDLILHSVKRVIA